METPIKYSDLIRPDDSIEKAIQQLEELQKQYTAMAAEIKKQYRRSLPARRRDLTLWKWIMLRSPPFRTGGSMPSFCTGYQRAFCRSGMTRAGSVCSEREDSRMMLRRTRHYSSKICLPLLILYGWISFLLMSVTIRESCVIRSVRGSPERMRWCRMTPWV